MPTLNLKSSHQPVKAYYAALQQTTQQMSLLHEGAVSPHFANLLRVCAARMGWALVEQHPIPRKGRRPLPVLAAASSTTPTEPKTKSTSCA